MSFFNTVPLNPIFAHLPTPQPTADYHYTVAILTFFITKLVLVAPHTGAWKLFRIGVAAPAVSVVWGWIIVSRIDPLNAVHWGVSNLCANFIMRTLEYLVFFPPEEHCHRLIPRVRPSSSHLEASNGSSNPHPESKSAHTDLVPESVPAPFTWAKVCWAWSLWWSYRGIGWNHACPLPPSSLRKPYTRESTRLRFFLTQARKWVIYWMIDDFCRALQGLSSASGYFSGIPGIAPLYTDLSQWQRGLYSTTVVVRVWFSLHNSHLIVGCLCVAIGGLLGWEGEMFTPWGWPPLLGSLEDLWKYPGLSTLWSRTWQGYNRRWLYVLGWIGIGENILGLTHTGISAHPTIPSENRIQSLSSNVSPHPSGQVSPSHPIPSTPTRLPTRRMSTRLMVQNLIKSLIVFAMSGLWHDVGIFSLIVKDGPPKKLIYLSDVIKLTPFFVVQPLALAVEAVVKSVWRGWKSKQYSEWRKISPSSSSRTSLNGTTTPIGKEPAWLIFLERAIGFAWTWIWLGWTARWFVEGVSKAGAYMYGEGQTEAFSLSGGLFWGRWYF